MSSLLDALNKSMRKNTPRTLRGRANLLGEVVEYGEKTIKVKVLNGPIAGQEIDIIPGADPVSKFSKASRAQTSSYTQPGGILRFDNVQADANGVYKSSWVNAFIKTPNESNVLVLDQMATFVDTGRNNSTGKPILRLTSFDPKAETLVKGIDEMRDAIAAAFASTGGVLVIDTADGGFASREFRLPGKRTDAGYVFEDPTAFAQKLIDDMGEAMRDLYVKALTENGLTIVPLKSVILGPTTAEEIKKAEAKAAEAGKAPRIMSVNPLAYKAPGLGDRLAAALLRTGDLEIPKEHQERLKVAFLSTAAEEAKAAFHSGGWRAVADVDLKEFFAKNGVELKKHPETQWNSAAIHLQKYENGSDFFVAKTYEASRYGTPYPNLECCKELRAAYGVELTEAIRSAMGNPVVAKQSEAEVPAAKEAAAATPVDAEAPVSDVEDIDALLDNLASSEMEIG